MDRVLIGAFLSKVRAQKNISVTRMSREISAKTGKVLPTYKIRGVESGELKYTIDTLLSICDYLGVSLDLTEKE